ncbi:MAG: hypothetical protein WED05_08645 [Candidatus Atabeyarchaeum deiterrae]
MARRENPSRDVKIMWVTGRGFATALLIVYIIFTSVPVVPTAANSIAGEAKPILSLGSALGFEGLGPEINDGPPKIAVVQPIFSDTAYSNAFYVFYAKYGSSGQEYITTDLNYLNVTVKFGWGYSSALSDFLFSSKASEQGLIIDKTFTIIDEINVAAGGLFRNGRRIYDVLILGFTEYVTSEEYFAYKEFVATGGRLVIMDACNFLAEVRYYPPASPSQPGYLSLVKGHGWEFNGTHAWKSVYARWPEENANWVGSNFWKYWTGTHYDFFVTCTSHPISIYLRDKFGESISTSYSSHEENMLQNFTNTEVIGYWHLVDPSEFPGQPIAAYQHRYVNGTVFHTGIMASDIVDREGFMQSFLLTASGVVSTEAAVSMYTLTIIAAAITRVGIVVCPVTIYGIRSRKKGRVAKKSRQTHSLKRAKRLISFQSRDHLS